MKPCPFCGGSAEYEKSSVRSGYGEYERLETYHSVFCQKCRARGRKYHQKALVDYTSHTVSDFRNNPILRAKVEEEYEAYCEQTKQLAIEAWENRA